jgi:hypothetical protein
VNSVSAEWLRLPEQSDSAAGMQPQKEDAVAAALCRRAVTERAGLTGVAKIFGSDNLAA